MSRPIHWLLLALLCAVLPTAGLASPWARDPGRSFFALSAERDRSGNDSAALYGEYGLSPRNTLILQLDHNAAEDGALLSWQRALGNPDRPDRWAISFGLGAIRRDGRLHPMGQIGTGWGRGFDSIPGLRRIPGGGWLAVETRSKIAAISTEIEAPPNVIIEDPTFLTSETEHKAEVTLGWHASDSLMLISQLRFEKRDDTGFASKLALSAVRDLTGPASLELGLTEPLSGVGERSLKLGLWLNF